MTQTDRRIAVGLFVVAFVTFASFFGGGGWNQNAHFDLTRALVERQTLDIDGYRVNSGDITWSTFPDRAWHAYNNKPPGLAMLAAIPYAALHAIEVRRGAPIDAWHVMTLNVWLLTVVACAIPGALIPAVVYRYARRADAAPSWALFAALSTAFATIVFPYATVFYAMLPAALALLLAFVWRDEHPILAGAAAGIAVMCFYVASFAVLAIAVDLLLRSRARTLRFIAGGVPFAILLAAYHTLCFGAPWRASLAGKNSFAQKDALFGFFRFPSLDATWGLTFSEYRGLFFVSPVLLLSFAGAMVMLRRGALRRDALVIGAAALLTLLAIASFTGWEAGFAFGPRHLLPALPLAALPLAFLRGRVLAAIAIALATVSASMQFIAAAVDVQPNAAIARPFRDYLLPEFLAGRISANTQSVDELTPNALHPLGSLESDRAAFNICELILPRNVSWIPIALWLLTGSLLLIRQARRSSQASSSCPGTEDRFRCRSRSRRR